MAEICKPVKSLLYQKKKHFLKSLLKDRFFSPVRTERRNEPFLIAFTALPNLCVRWFDLMWNPLDRHLFWQTKMLNLGMHTDFFQPKDNNYVILKANIFTWTCSSFTAEGGRG